MSQEDIPDIEMRPKGMIVQGHEDQRIFHRQSAKKHEHLAS